MVVKRFDVYLVNLDPTVGHEISVEEALQHIDRAIKAGLIPCVAKAVLDNLYFGI